MDSLTERLKKCVEDNQVKSMHIFWEIIDQEIVAWKVKRARWLKNMRPSYIVADAVKSGQVINRLINESFEISEPEKQGCACGSDKFCPVDEPPKPQKWME